MANPKIILKSRVAFPPPTNGGNADHWEVVDFTKIEEIGDKQWLLTLKSAQTQVDINNYSWQRAWYKLGDTSWVDLAGRFQEADKGQTHTFAYSKDLRIALMGSEIGPVFATLTLTKGGGQGGD